MHRSWSHSDSYNIRRPPSSSTCTKQRNQGNAISGKATSHHPRFHLMLREHLWDKTPSNNSIISMDPMDLAYGSLVPLQRPSSTPCYVVALLQLYTLMKSTIMRKWVKYTSGKIFFWSRGKKVFPSGESNPALGLERAIS